MPDIKAAAEQQLPVRTVTVLVYKPLIAEPEKFQNTKYLLHYGLKVWPEDFETVKSKAPEAENLGGL